MSKARASKKRAQDSIREALRQRVVLAFRVSGLAQREIADAFDVTEATVCRWCHPDPAQGRMPPPAAIARIPKATGVADKWLLSGDGPMRSDGRGPRRLRPLATKAALRAVVQLHEANRRSVVRRNAEIVARRADGESLASIASDYGITYQRAQTIVRKALARIAAEAR